MDGISLTASELSSPTGQTANLKHNFKTFSLLRQQDDRISQFESNLQKTLELLSRHQTDRSCASDRKTEIPVESNTLSTQPILTTVPTTTNNYEEVQNASPKSMRETLVPVETGNTESQVELHAEELSRISHVSNTFKSSSLESEIRSLKMQLSDLEKENQILKSSLHSLSLVRNSVTEFETRRSERAGDQRELQELRAKLSEAQSDNESLRQELLKIKSESYSKFETLQKNNDELLESYEQRVNIT